MPTQQYFDFVKENGRPPQTVDEAEGAYLMFKYPKIWEVGAIGSIAERSLEGFLDSQPAEAAEHIKNIILDQFSINFLPQAAAPSLETWANKRQFLGRPIEGAGMQDLQPWARSSPYGSRSLRALGEASRDVPVLRNVSPAKVEAWLRGHFNHWAQYGLTLADAAMFDDMPDLRADRYPIARRFFSAQPTRRSKAVEDLWKAVREATEARRTMRHMQRTYRPDIGNELAQTPENKHYQQLSAAQRRMATFRKVLDRVTRLPMIEEAQEMVRYRARATRRSLVPQLRRQGLWDDLGALKGWLRDEVTHDQNRYARGVMAEIEKPQKETARPK